MREPRRQRRLVEAQTFTVSEDGRWISESVIRRLRHGLPLLRAWTRREVAIRYRQSALGFLWVIAQPALALLVIGVVVNRVFGIDGAGLPYVSFAYAGLALWTFVASTLTLGAVALQNAMPIASKTYFPREVVPIAVAGANGIDLALGGVLLVMLAAIQSIQPSITLLALPLVLLVAWLAVAGAVVFLSVVAVFVRDIRHAVPAIVQLGFFATPVMYPTDLLPPSLQWLDDVNPLAVAIESVRDTALRGQWPQWPLLFAHLAAALAVITLAIKYTQSVEPRLVDVA